MIAATKQNFDLIGIVIFWIAKQEHDPSLLRDDPRAEAEKLLVIGC